MTLTDWWTIFQYWFVIVFQPASIVVLGITALVALIATLYDNGRNVFRV